jgi:hypothetical protein
VIKRPCTIETHRELARSLDTIESEIAELEKAARPYTTRRDREGVSRYARYYLREFRFRLDCLLFREHGRGHDADQLREIYKSGLVFR